MRLFRAIAAGYAPLPWLLAAASVLAEAGPWACMAIMGWAAWRKPSERGYAMATLAAAATASVMAHTIASAANLPRPFALGLSPNYMAHGERGAFPSAHATVMFTVALIFALRPRLRVWGAAMIAIAAATSWARIYTGAHFPSDVAAGFLLGVLIAAAFCCLHWLLRRIAAPLVVREGPAAADQAVAIEDHVR